MPAPSALDPLQIAPSRSIQMEFLTGRALYQRVVHDTVAQARVSVWIATANVKEMLVEAPVGSRERANGAFVSSMSLLATLAGHGVDVRILHAAMPSRAFARSMVRNRGRLATRSARGASGVRLARCPRVHMKAIVVDGASVYLGSANWTGAGLGAKADGRRNFEIGFLSTDDLLLDDVQALYDRIWSGRACQTCRIREICPEPLDERPTGEPREPV